LAYSNAYGNLAYDDAYSKQFDENERIRQEKRLVSRKEKQMMQRRANFRIVCVIAALFFAAYFMISKNVQVNDTAAEIKSLEKELATLESNTSQKMFELEQSVDLNTVEEIAGTKLNMQRPEKHQVVYINIKTDDVTEVTADRVEGVKNQIENTAGKLKKNVLGIFDFGWK